MPKQGFSSVGYAFDLHDFLEGRLRNRVSDSSLVNQGSKMGQPHIK